MAWSDFELRALLVPKQTKVTIEPGRLYKQITVRLWGKGLSLRQVCDGAEIAAERQVEVTAGDFLISKIDARHGAFGLVPDHLDGAVVSADFPCFEINEKIVLPKFLEWLSKSELFIERCKLASKGSTNRVRLNEDRFLELTISLPSLEEQRAITQRLDAVQTGLDQRSQLLTDLEQEAAAMLHSAFQDMITECDYLKLKEVAPLVRRPVEVDIDGEYPELGVRSFGKGTFQKPTLSGADIGSKRMYEIHANDLLFSNVFAWEGAIAVPSDKDHGRVGSHRFMTFVPNSELATANFLRFYLLSPEGIEKVRDASPGGAGRNRTLGIKKAEKITVPVPDIESQRRFDQLQEHVETMQAIHASAGKDAEALIPAILHQIFGQAEDTAGTATESTNVVKLPQKHAAKIDTPFKEAVLVAAIIQAFHSDGDQPLGNFRLQKAVYFGRRFLGERALGQNYLRKAAGPYNPQMRYAGGIKLALEMSWIEPTAGKYGNGHSPGTANSEAHDWIEKYSLGQTANWVSDNFKFRKNEAWELLATVDYAMLALGWPQSKPTAKAVLDFIDGDPEWHPKVEKLGLDEAKTQNAMNEVDVLFGDINADIDDDQANHATDISIM